jgi:hypothetical protein
MPVENLPVWGLLPNWRETVSERLTWYTTVLTSASGAEQRYAARNLPRRLQEASFLPEGPVRAWMANALQAAFAARWWVPLFHEVAYTTAALTSGTTIPVDTTDREFVVGGFVMLVKPDDPLTASVHQIAAVGGSTLTLEATDPIFYVFPAGSAVMPCAVARMPEKSTLRRHHSRAMEVRIQFEMEDPAVYTPAVLTPTYGGYPVLDTPPNETGDMTIQYDRILQEFSTPLTRKLVRDTANKGFPVTQYRWMAVGRAEQNALRGYFYALNGKRVLTWLPSFDEDFDIIGAAASGSSAMNVKKTGGARFGGVRFNRDHIQVALYDGSTINREIASLIESTNNEVLTVDSAWGTALSQDNIKRVSYLTLARLDQDTIEIIHYSDKDGAATVSAAFRSVGDIRTPQAMVRLPFGDTEMIEGQCGNCSEE